MKQGEYRYNIFDSSRGLCDVCLDKERKTTVLIRMFSPVKEELRICHNCLIDHIRAKKIPQDDIMDIAEEIATVLEQSTKEVTIGRRKSKR